MLKKSKHLSMDQADHDKIQRYLNQEMSSEEKAAFDQSIQLDEGLAELLAFEIATRKAAKAKRLKAIDDAADEYGVPKKSKKSFLKYAAMITLLILAGLAFYFWPVGDLKNLRKQNDEVALNDIIVKSKYDLDVAGFRMASLLNDRKYPQAAKEIRGFLDLKHNQKLNPCD